MATITITFMDDDSSEDSVMVDYHIKPGGGDGPTSAKVMAARVFNYAVSISEAPPQVVSDTAGGLHVFGGDSDMFGKL